MRSLRKEKERQCTPSCFTLKLGPKHHSPGVAREAEITTDVRGAETEWPAAQPLWSWGLLLKPLPLCPWSQPALGFPPSQHSFFHPFIGPLASDRPSNAFPPGAQALFCFLTPFPSTSFSVFSRTHPPLHPPSSRPGLSSGTERPPDRWAPKPLTHPVQPRAHQPPSPDPSLSHPQCEGAQLSQQGLRGCCGLCLSAPTPGSPAGSFQRPLPTCLLHLPVTHFVLPEGTF